MYSARDSWNNIILNALAERERKRERSARDHQSPRPNYWATSREPERKTKYYRLNDLDMRMYIWTQYITFYYKGIA